MSDKYAELTQLRREAARSIRSFKPSPVPREVLEELLETLFFFLTGCAIYPYHWKAGCHLPDYTKGSTREGTLIPTWSETSVSHSRARQS